MISWEQAKDGTKIPVMDKKSLASKFAPRKEAMSWAKRALEDLQEDIEVLIVLGVGAGLHIEELEKSFNGKIYALDYNDDFVLSRSNSERVKYFRVTKKNKIWKEIHFEESQLGKWKVLLFGPAICAQKEEYFCLRDFINLRSLQSIHLFLDQYSCKAFEDIEFRLRDRYVDLGTTGREKPGFVNTKKHYMWKILGEILK